VLLTENYLNMQQHGGSATENNHAAVVTGQQQADKQQKTQNCNTLTHTHKDVHQHLMDKRAKVIPFCCQANFAWKHRARPMFSNQIGLTAADRLLALQLQQKMTAAAQTC
jgi:hypothetical protein